MAIYVSAFGNDKLPDGTTNNPGTTEAAPKRYLGTALGTLSRALGQEILLARGQYHDVAAVGAGINSVQGSHIRIRPYGLETLGKPCIDLRNWIPKGSNRFTYVDTATGPDGGHVWSIIIGTSDTAYRVWTNAKNEGFLLEQRSVGEALRHVPNEGSGAVTDNLTQIRAALSETNSWYGSGTGLGRAIYIWTKENVDPADYWNGLAIAQSGPGTMGSDSVFNVFRTQDLVVSQIDSWGARRNALTVSAAPGQNVPCANIRFEDCDAYGISFSISRAAQTSTAASLAAGNPSMVFDVEFLRCRGYTNSGPREQEPSHLTHSRLSGSTDMFNFTGPIEKVISNDCESHDANHSAATVGAIDANSARPKNTGFRRLKAYASEWNTYARGISSFCATNTSFFDQTMLSGMNVRNQLTGASLINSLTMVNNRASIRDPNTDGYFSFEAYVFNSDPNNTRGIGNERYLIIQPEGVRIVNASLAPTNGTPIEINSYDTSVTGITKPQILEGSIIMENVMILDTNPARVNLPVLTTIQQLPIGDQVFNNLSVRKADGSPGKVRYRNVDYTVLNAPGFKDALISDPLVDENLRPSPSSPLVEAGTPTKLVGARDVLGRKFRKRPTIGAFESFG